MQQIGRILSSVITQQSRNKSRRVNLSWEQAKEFGDYIGIEDPKKVLRLFKVFGKEVVLGYRSFMKDAPCVPKYRFQYLYKVLYNKKHGLTPWDK